VEIMHNCMISPSLFLSLSLSPSVSLSVSLPPSLCWSHQIQTPYLVAPFALDPLIALQYVWRQVMSETAAVLSGGTTVGGLSVGHWAHLGGAIGGVLLVLLLSRLPKGDE